MRRGQLAERLARKLAGEPPTCPKCGYVGLPKPLDDEWFCNNGECTVYRYDQYGRILLDGWRYK